MTNDLESYSTGVADHPSPRHVLAAESYEHASVTASPGGGHPAILHTREVLFGCQFEPPKHHNASTRFEELVGFVDLESAVGVKCVAVDLAVGNRTEGDALVDER